MVVPDDSPYTTGGLGLLGTAPSEELMEEIDTLLMLGTNFPYTKFLPEPGRVKVVQVDIEPARVGTRIPTDVPLVGDVGADPGGAAPAAASAKDDEHLEKYQRKTRDWRRGDGGTRSRRSGTRSRRSTWRSSSTCWPPTTRC